MQTSEEYRKNLFFQFLKESNKIANYFRYNDAISLFIVSEKFAANDFQIANVCVLNVTESTTNGAPSHCERTIEEY